MSETDELAGLDPPRPAKPLVVGVNPNRDQIDHGRTLTAEYDAQTRLGATEDHRNAVHAFLAKQKPTFTGH